MHHEPETIRQPNINVYLLDPEPTELVKEKIPLWPYPPREPPAPVPAKLKPPPT